tara:strand:+ start:2109 stop:2519 length:411 start_codon:yes stop_codon:yes gene_type:complete
MVEILKKQYTRLRVKQVSAPLSTSPILGSGIDVMCLPEGHMSCANCAGYKFEASSILDAQRVELGCMGCGQAYRLLFPMDLAIPFQGRFICKSHPTKGMIVIHNIDTLCIGCEICFTELQIKLRTETNIIMPGDLN